MASKSAAGPLECAVCLQSCIHPSQLPCGHIFCYLCVKGVANQSKRCAMCRQEIPFDYLDNPLLVNFTVNGDPITEQEVTDNEYQWFYEGRNGWWKYDVRTNKELDLAFQSDVPRCELLIAGFLYIIDFDSMLQLRRNDPTRRRKIKRDVISIPVKGIAGIKLNIENIVTKSLTTRTINDNILTPPNVPMNVGHSGTILPITVDIDDSNSLDSNLESSDISYDEIDENSN